MKLCFVEDESAEAPENIGPSLEYLKKVIFERGDSMRSITICDLASVFKRVLIVTACCASLGWIRAAAASDWPTYGHDPQRSGWAVGRDHADTGECCESLAEVKVKFKNEPLSLTALTAAVVSDHVDTVQGPRTVVYVAGSSNHMFAVDAANGTVLWSHDFETHVSIKDETMWLCPKQPERHAGY